MPSPVTCRSVLPVLLASLLVSAPQPAVAKTYRAERYDVTLAVRSDGGLDVRETATFVFEGEGDSFQRVYRDIPATRTDGIEILGVTFDGQPRALDGSDVRVSPHANGVRVEVTFPPLSRGRRVLELRYRARQAVSREADAARLRWTPLPDRRGYPIDASTVEIAWPGLSAPPTAVRTRRDDGVSVVVVRHPETITIAAANLRPNRTYQVRLELPSAALSPERPQWQQALDAREARRRERMAYGGVAGGLVVLGFLLVWRRHRPPEPEPPRATTARAGPPSTLPVALASALTRHGNVVASDLEATVVDLARQGVVRIEGSPDARDGGGHRLVRRDDTHPAHDHEREALALLFPGRRSGEAEVGYAEALAEAAKAWSPYKQAVRRELLRGGWLDEQRAQVRAGMVRVALLAIVAGIAGVALVLLTATGPEQRDWVWVPGGVALAGVVGLMVGGAVSPLSDRGAAEAARWKVYRRALSAAARGKSPGAGADWSRALPFAIACGLGGALAARAASLGLKPPDWFVHERPREADASFVGWLAASGPASGGDSGSTSASDGGGSGGDGGGGGGSGAD